MIWFSIKQHNSGFSQNSEKVQANIKRSIARMIEMGSCVMVDTENCTINSRQLEKLLDGFPENKLKCLDFTKGLSEKQ